MRTSFRCFVVCNTAAAGRRFRMRKSACISFLLAGLAITWIEVFAAHLSEHFDEQVSVEGGLTSFDADDPNLPAKS